METPQTGLVLPASCTAEALDSFIRKLHSGGSVPSKIAIGLQTKGGILFSGAVLVADAERLCQCMGDWVYTKDGSEVDVLLTAAEHGYLVHSLQADPAKSLRGAYTL